MLAVLVLSILAVTQGAEEISVDKRWFLVKQHCFAIYGCFDNYAPFDNTQGFLPDDPDDLGIHFLLYTRKNPTHAQMLHEFSAGSVQASNFNPHNPTKFIIHGYTDSGHAQWVKDMTRELLNNADMNVIAVDWQKGADNINYFLVAANTRVVGAVTAELVKTLNAEGSSLSSFHLIGHSLGAHIAGHVGERVKGLGRISGMDPAGLSFESYDPVVRLDPTDANFVDIMHTDAETLVNLGLGVIKPIGDADFYPNGGKNQPGCPRHHGHHILNVVTGGFPKVTDGASCSHNRARDFYIASINNHCPFSSYNCGGSTTYDSAHCHTCPLHGCTKMGYHASPSQHGVFFVETHSTSAPYYC